MSEKTRNDGGPAFPKHTQSLAMSDAVESWVETLPGSAGMSLRDYFAAHAPTERWRHYWPTPSTPRPDPDWAGIPESARQYEASPNNWKELAAWDTEDARQYDLQWPYFYADAMLAERSK